MLMLKKRIKNMDTNPNKDYFYTLQFKFHRVLLNEGNYPEWAIC